MWFQLLIRVKILGYFLGSKFDVHMQLLFKVAFMHDYYMLGHDSINLNWIVCWG